MPPVTHRLASVLSWAIVLLGAIHVAATPLVPASELPTRLAVLSFVLVGVATAAAGLLLVARTRRAVPALAAVAAGVFVAVVGVGFAWVDPANPFAYAALGLGVAASVMGRLPG